MKWSDVGLKLLSRDSKTFGGLSILTFARGKMAREPILLPTRIMLARLGKQVRAYPYIVSSSIQSGIVPYLTIYSIGKMPNGLTDKDCMGLFQTWMSSKDDKRIKIEPNTEVACLYSFLLS